MSGFRKAYSGLANAQVIEHLRFVGQMTQYHGFRLTVVLLIVGRRPLFNAD